MLIIVNCFQTICKLRLKFAYQSEQAFVTVTVGTIGWIRYSLWPKLGLFVLTRESRTFPNSSRPISPYGIVPEMFLYPKYSVFSETERVLERQIPDRRAVRPKSRSHRCFKSYAHSQGCQCCAAISKSAEFLMAQKSADYFSRLAAKRNTDKNTQKEDDEEEAASLENETHLQLI